GIRALRKDHRPADPRGRAPQLAVDEVGDADEEQSRRRDRHDQIAEVKKRDLLGTAKPGERDRDADESAMTRHAAFPHAEKTQWVAEQLPGLIEQKRSDT